MASITRTMKKQLSIHKVSFIFVMLSMVHSSSEAGYDEEVVEENRKQVGRFEEELHVSMYVVHPELEENELTYERVGTSTTDLEDRLFSGIFSIDLNKQSVPLEEEESYGRNPYDYFESKLTQLEVLNLTGKTSMSRMQNMGNVKREQDPDFKLISSDLTFYVHQNETAKRVFCCHLSRRNCLKPILIKSHLMTGLWKDILFGMTEIGRRSINHNKELDVNNGECNVCPNVQFESWLPITMESIELPYQCIHGQENDGKESGYRVKIDTTEITQLWLTKNEDPFRRSFGLSLIFSLTFEIDPVIWKEEISRDSVMDKSSIGSTISEAALHIEYFIDRRCSVPVKEECTFGSCIHADKLCRIREYCPDTKCGVTCNFEEACDWTWDEHKSETQPGFQIITGEDVFNTRSKLPDPIFDYSGPIVDADNNQTGHFLLLVLTKPVSQSAVYHLHSPWFTQSDGSCYLEAMLHMYNMKDGSFKMLLNRQNHTTWVPVTKVGNDKNMWERLKENIGKSTEPFQVSLEFSPSSKVPSHIAIDNIRLVNCFPQPVKVNKVCSLQEFRCHNDMCITRDKVCDYMKDCPQGEDEQQQCEKMPVNTTCNFESDWCGWTNVSERNIKWERTNKPSTSPITGPGYGDHTFQDIQNSSGYFLYVDMNAKNSMMFDKTYLRSSIFAPPPQYHQNESSPYYNSCQLRFFYHMFGPHVGSLHVEILELNPKFPKSTRIWSMSRTQGNIWHRVSVPVPKINYMYYVQFVATRGPRFAGDMALDDISLTRECVGLGVPLSELKGYSYEALMKKPRVDTSPRVITMNMQNITKYVFTTCGKYGRDGPSPEQCESSYKDTSLNSSVKVLTEPGSKGFQVWTVPETKHYTFVAKGAGGGRGAVINQMSSHGSIVKVTLFIRKGEQIYALIGQEGASVCEQNISGLPEKIREICGRSISPQAAVARIVRANKGRDALSELQRMNNLLGGGGGGGGATYVFRKETKEFVPILVAAGGGGLGYNASPNILPYGRGLNASLDARSGSTHPHGAGGGGGWKGPIVPVNIDSDSLDEITRILGASQQQKERKRDNATMWISAGNSVLDGGSIGGLPCIDSVQWGTVGGYGGGGGGCTAGGAGGGYVGGNAHNGLSANGDGGISFIVKGGMYPSVEPGGNDGPGSLIVIPSVEGCGCDYQCVLLDDLRFHSACVCPENGILSDDGFICVDKDPAIPMPYLIVLIIIGVVMFAFIGLLCICLYNKYQRQKVALHRKGVAGGPELQLSRLRQASGPGGVLTEYNPNYEFGGETYNLTDLKEIPRENLRLVKALGQGAFGEVYQGFYKHRAGDAVEMPVAVKTLPELSSNQAEMDFLMEALIMSKFNHPNIVHFIGVCFDKHPRFIILELLAGGDLKTFLRESRPKPERASPLTMKDLLLCAMDVSKGCKYLEENHFIHRDIAARNCLLTTKGPGRVVKIADFGMARDIYRADYYKKGGKAMLPVKWMPPEAFLDGIFTSKTDVWSYGVLLWEVMSLGYMPYPGRGNQDVMQLVTNGGRLEPPTNCPGPVYGIMTQCWHPIPEERPNFGTLIERVGYCLQDPEVVNAPLPVFQRPPSSERDATLMRPLNSDDQSCLRIVQGHRGSNAMNSTSPSTPNSSTADYLVPLTPFGNPSSPSPLPTTNGKKPPSAVGISGSANQSLDSPSTGIPESESTQTLLEDEEEQLAQSRDMQKALNSSAPIYQMSSTNSKPSSNGRGNSTSSRKQNGIDSGVMLNASALNKSSRKPYPYANVGMKNKQGTGNDGAEEEVRC